MKAEDLKAKTQDELKKLLLDTRKEQMNDRFQLQGRTLEDTSKMRKNRRAIARIKTFLNAKEKGVETKVKAPAKKTAAKKTTKAKKDAA